MTVRLLDRDVAERIAAGEVIERPASVVKELVENALDAGARRVLVDLREGGLEALRVADDGGGMTRDDLSLAVQRFATSKIGRWEDLDALTTYGFRGEALPSIAAISQLEVSTRSADSPWGWRILLRGGELVRLEEAGVPPGTTVLVTDLFYNTPARKKFLKAPVSEAARVQELVGAMSVTTPHVHFTFRHNGKELLDLPAGPGVTLDRLRRIWGVAREQAFVQLQDSEVEGWLSTPDLLWPNRRKLLIFVNRRLVSTPALSHAVADGVGAGRGRYPLGAVFVTVPGDEVDVNVHPTKAEIRFRYADQVFRRVRQAVSRAQQGVAVRSGPTLPRAPLPPTDWRHAALEPFAAWPDPAPSRTPSPSSFTGRTGDGLGVALVAGRLWVVDPHVFFERRLRQRMEGKPSPMALVFPVLVELPAPVVEKVSSALPALQAMGLALERFGPATFVLRSVPEGGERLADSGRLRELLTRTTVGEAWLPRFLAAAACAGAPDEGEAEQLLAEVVDDDLLPDCGAHGRAAVLQLGGEMLRALLAGRAAGIAAPQP